MFFSEEKNQKTFASPRLPRSRTWPARWNPRRSQSFLLLFFKKDVLPFLPDLKGSAVLYGRNLDCVCDTPEGLVHSVYTVRPDRLQSWQDALPAPQAAYLRATGFTAKAGQISLLPDKEGLAGAVLGLGSETGPHVFGALPGALPPGTVWRMAAEVEDPAAFVLGFCMGAYRFRPLKTDTSPASARLLVDNITRISPEIARSLSAAKAAWLVRDLINTPANLLGPAELAFHAAEILTAAGAHANVIGGDRVMENYPALHAVGRGSDREPAVLVARWRAPTAPEDAPIISICGKGVCFDTGGYDLKPPGNMLRMKKDMGGAAISLGLACMIIEAELPCRLELRLGCVENMVSGNAMRPLDVLKTRKGLSVEVGNTDAEGRLVLCDLLAEACESNPQILLDFATLTGAARTALGPDIAALFSNDDALAGHFLAAGVCIHDPVWRLPLWDGYNYWLDCDTADLNNVTEKSYAGALVAALFLQRFVSPGASWAHFDVYGWNDASRPGRPAGGEATAMRAAFEGLRRMLAARTKL